MRVSGILSISVQFISKLFLNKKILKTETIQRPLQINSIVINLTSSTFRRKRLETKQQWSTIFSTQSPAPGKAIELWFWEEGLAGCS